MVFLVATPTDAGTIWGTAAKCSFAPQWIGQSPAWIGALAASPLEDYLAQTTLIVAEGTEWGDTRSPGMAQMVDDVEEVRPEQEPDYYFVFGYNQARAMAAVLEKAVENGDLSREGIAEGLGGVGHRLLRRPHRRLQLRARIATRRGPRRSSRSTRTSRSGSRR